jgi:hypothetical protein
MSSPSLEDRLAEIERRLAALEADSHPPVDLTKPAYQAMAAILRDAADEAARHG